MDLAGERRNPLLTRSPALLIANPRSGGGATGRRLSQILELGRRLFDDIEMVTTEAPGHAVALAETAAKAGRSPVIAVGGDGTVSQVVDGLFRAGESGRAPVELGIVPAGTGGDLARTLGIPRSAERAMLGIACGRSETIDAARICYKADDGADALSHYVNIADAGLGGETVRYVESMKRLPGKAAYLAGSIVAIARHRPRRVRIDLNDGAELHEIEAGVVAVANGRYFGGGMQIAPRADPSDGELDVIAIAHCPPLEALRLLAKIYRGSAFDDPRVLWRRARRVRLDAPSAEQVLLDVDGEQPGRLPATFEALPGALTIRI